MNIRLFLAKIVINMPEAFEMYAHSWIRPFMRLAMEGETFGESMNYFVQVGLLVLDCLVRQMTCLGMSLSSPPMPFLFEMLLGSVRSDRGLGHIGQTRE